MNTGQVYIIAPYPSVFSQHHSYLPINHLHSTINVHDAVKILGNTAAALWVD